MGVKPKFNNTRRPTSQKPCGPILSQRVLLGEIEMHPFPHARSREAVEAQARLRGSQVGMMAAEAFQTELDLS